MRTTFSDLYSAVTEEKLFGGDNEAVIQEGRARNKKVCSSRLVFKRNEAVSFCGAGSLAADYKSNTADMLAVWYEFEIAGFGEQRGVDRRTVLSSAGITFHALKFMCPRFA
tara:strand:- start:494 stop:826 length:333 start_codon:yes stop_codon:yes gene_type:complete